MRKLVILGDRNFHSRRTGNAEKQWPAPACQAPANAEKQVRRGIRNDKTVREATNRSMSRLITVYALVLCACYALAWNSPAPGTHTQVVILGTGNPNADPERSGPASTIRRTWWIAGRAWCGGRRRRRSRVSRR